MDRYHLRQISHVLQSGAEFAVYDFPQIGSFENFDLFSLYLFRCFLTDNIYDAFGLFHPLEVSFGVSGGFDSGLELLF
jgi:hypothetical protein